MTSVLRYSRSLGLVLQGIQGVKWCVPVVFKYLRGQEGGAAEWVIAAIAAVGLLYLADTSFQRGARTAMNEPDFPQGAQEEFKHTADKFTFVYEGQQEPTDPCIKILSQRSADSLCGRHFRIPRLKVSSLSSVALFCQTE